MPPLARRSTQLLLAGVVALMFAWQAAVGFRHWMHQDNATDRRADIGVVQIDINHCQSRELALLPNVGPVLAARMIADREANGPFVSVDDLKRVHGMGAKRVERMAIYCVVEKSISVGSSARTESTMQQDSVAKHLVASTAEKH